MSTAELPLPAVRMTVTHGAPAAPARRAVEHALQTWQLAHLAEDALLVTTELVENVTRHTTGDGELRVLLQDEGVLIEVADTSPEPPVLRPVDLRRPSGRGLLIVAAVASRWGHRAASSGKVIWARLDLGPTAA